jgi:hypothetical protein
MSLGNLTYMPVFRGKQYELKLLEVMLPFIQGHPVVPIVEPVTANTAQLEHVIDYYKTFAVPLGVVCNPSVGAFRKSPEHLIARTGASLLRRSSAFPVCRVRSGYIDWAWLEKADRFVLIEDGTLDRETLTKLRCAAGSIAYRIMAHKDASAADFELPGDRILLGQGFPRRPNAEHPPDEKFLSGPGRLDLRSVSGWADYSVVGEQYQESGARPHAVAIHVTYWDPDDEGLRVRHYLSDRAEGPEDAEGKFGEALQKLVSDLDAGTYPILETSAIGEFRALHAREHCPALPTVKFLSMQHHLETVLECLCPRQAA